MACEFIKIRRRRRRRRRSETIFGFEVFGRLWFRFFCCFVWHWLAASFIVCEMPPNDASIAVAPKKPPGRVSLRKKAGELRFTPCELRCYIITIIIIVFVAVVVLIFSY